MRAYLKDRPLGTRVPTGLERRCESLMEGVGYRGMVRQVDLGGHEWIGRVDSIDWNLLLVLEVNSSTFHDSYLDQLHDQRRVAELLGAGFRGVLQVEEEVVWYRPNDFLGGIAQARSALSGRSVMWKATPGVAFHMTKRSDGAAEAS